VSEFFDIAIIGGGYTGAVLALHLARHAPAGTQIAIVEPRAELGSGLAYETLADEHHINVPADRMGVGVEAPDRFDIWLKACHPELIGDGDPEQTYVSRRWFGIFVRDRLADALRNSRVSLRHIKARALSARRIKGGTEILLSGGEKPLRARHVVIAVSHGLPALPHGIPPALAGKRGLLENPWDIESLAEIPPGGTVLIIGTGLTMADIVASLVARGHRGPILALSRHGLLARKAGPAGVPPGLDLATWPAASLAQYVKRIRAEIARIEAQGLSWRGVFTALRIQSEYLWSRLTRADQRRFLRHLKAFYDVHRYRMTPETYELIEAAEARGQVEIFAAHLVRAEAMATGFGAVIRRRGAPADEHLAVAAIVNCTGPKQSLAADPTTFLGAVMAAGIARVDPLGLGLAVDRDFRAIGGAPNVYAIGPLTRERFGDTYGAPEIQIHAERLAGQLAIALTEEKAAV
jgi:uncharacterized NAD(P)/FAD-binding protein YdhS